MKVAMWRDLSISPANQPRYEEVCRRLSQQRRERIFGCGHRKACSRKGDRFTTETLDKTPTSHDKEIQPSTASLHHKTEQKPATDPRDRTEATDIAALQKELLRAITSSGGLDEGLRAVGHVEVCQGAVEPVEDDVLVRACRRVEKRDGSMVALVGKLLLLPRLYHMQTKLSTPVMDSLTQLMEAHAAAVVDNAILPLLQHLPALEEHHRDLLAHLLPFCSPSMATSLLRAYAERPHHRETDLPTFHLLCESASVEEPDTHTAALTVLGQTAPMHRASVKFGQCLLVVVRRFGPHLSDLEGLRCAVKEHGSSLRKVVEMQMKKLERRR
ncbi:hypothetical protein O3P69_009265 [Scylla paramamosain]|uniref:Fanconi Anaemia group E protein C-terminal domain-containing protein n=3 Tax=Scylla paramamosain TaxID=85552 RepID=A0AAW0TC70_SCYPA